MRFIGFQDELDDLRSHRLMVYIQLGSERERLRAMYARLSVASLQDGLREGLEQHLSFLDDLYRRHIDGVCGWEDMEGLLSRRFMKRTTSDGDDARKKARFSM